MLPARDRQALRLQLKIKILPPWQQATHHFSRVLRTVRTYLDYNATARVEPAVLDAMLPFLRDRQGNASSRHSEGRLAGDAVEEARAKVAAAVNALPEEVVFTSSGTESNNAIIRGVAGAAFPRKPRIVTSAIEHPCVLCAARAMVNSPGCELVPVGCDENGLFARDDLEQAVADEKACVVSVMLANNETGVIQDIPAAAELARRGGAVLHTDCAQAFGKIPVDFNRLGADAMTLSGHKVGGPMGVAALVVRRNVEWLPLLEGGGHEDGRRSGTLNVAGIVGFGAAAMLAAQRVQTHTEELGKLRDALEEHLLFSGARIFAHGAQRLANTSCFGFAGIDGEALVVMLDQAGYAVASGAACSSFKDDASHVMLAMGFEQELARCAVRVSFGPENTAEEADGFARTVATLAHRMRSMSSVSAA